MSPRPGTIQTVLGPVAPELLGPTLMHEHVLCDLTPPELAAQRLPAVEIRLDNLFEIRHQWCSHAGHHVLNDRDLAVSELAHFGAAGGSAVVELTCEGIAPDPAGLPPNIVATPIIGGQWRAVKGSRYPVDFLICENSSDPHVPIASKLVSYS